MTEKAEGKLTLHQDDQQGQASSEVAERIVQKVAPFLRDPKETHTIVQVVRHAVSEQHYQGPLPHPDHLRGFEEISPGAAKRLIDMAEREQAHRHLMQRREMNYPYGGLVAGLTIALAAVGGSIYLAVIGATTVALALLGLPVAGCIGWFVKARVSLNEPPPPPPSQPKGKRRR